MNRELTRPSEIDSPWRRLPWVLAMALLIWGTILWGFGLLLGRMADDQESLKPITAELVEQPSPFKRTPMEPPRPKLMRQSPAQTPAQTQQSMTPSPPRTEYIDKATVQPAVPSIPLISLPEANLPASNKMTSDNVQSATERQAKISPKTSAGSITPPQFGAAYLDNPKPIYPATAKRMGMEGTVMLKVLVSREGESLKIEIAQSSGHEILDQAAAQTVKRWRFTPARKGDSPLEEWVQVPVAFHLKK